MLKSITSAWDFLNYWYFRYLMVTELYMVEKWERAVCNITIVIILCLLSFLNLTVIHYSSKIWNSAFGNATIYEPSSLS